VTTARIGLARDGDGNATTSFASKSILITGGCLSGSHRPPRWPTGKEIKRRSLTSIAQVRDIDSRATTAATSGSKSRGDARARDWHGAAHLKGGSNEPARGTVMTSVRGA